MKIRIKYWPAVSIKFTDTKMAMIVCTIDKKLIDIELSPAFTNLMIETLILHHCNINRGNLQTTM